MSNSITGTKNPYDQITAKPTKYNGRVYRSRLEARVAAYFDICNWEFEYEPIDLDGWSPDFELFHKSANCFVEVKPESGMFQIKKYMVVDLTKNPVMLFSPKGIILIFDQGVDYVKLDKEIWIEAGNRVMFLKPKM